MLLEKLDIHGVEIHGKGVARSNGRVVFVENALPGEIVDAWVYQKQKGVFFARTTLRHHESPDRISPFCNHFGTCGGCTWQNITYEKQLEFKRQFVVDAFKRIGKLTFPEIPEVLGCSDTAYYRNKLEFTFSNRNWLTNEQMNADVPFAPALGFHKPGLFDKVIDITHCHLQPEPSNKIRLALKEFAIEKNIPFFDLRKQEGMLRTLTIRTSTLGETLVIVMFFKNEPLVIAEVMNFLSDAFPEITSLNYVINDSGNDSIFNCEVITHKGNPFIREQLDGIEFHVGPKSFFQVNVPQVQRLFEKALEFADLRATETVYDLYCGIGSISLFISKHCARVIGIEQLDEAIIDARKNAEINRITNCSFFSGDVIKVLNDDFVNAHGKPDVVFIDPPRAGIHPKMATKLIELNPEKIVYVSCNPVTQARDLSLLSDRYEIQKIQPVDMFPQTYHIENVVGLQARH